MYKGYQNFNKISRVNKVASFKHSVRILTRCRI